MRTKKGSAMNAEARARARSEVVDEVSKWGVGAGILVVALFPLSIPFLVLTAVAVLPLLVPVLAAALLAGALLVTVRLGRGVVRLTRRGLGLGQEVPVRTTVKEERPAVSSLGIDHVPGQDQVVAAVDQVPQLAGHPQQRAGEAR
jgi:hypothetical protein